MEQTFEGAGQPRNESLVSSAEQVAHGEPTTNTDKGGSHLYTVSLHMRKARCASLGPLRCVITRVRMKVSGVRGCLTIGFGLPDCRPIKVVYPLGEVREGRR